MMLAHGVACWKEFVFLCLDFQHRQSYFVVVIVIYIIIFAGAFHTFMLDRAMW